MKDIDRLRKEKQILKSKLSAMPGIIGFGIAENVVIYVRDNDVAKKLGSPIDGIEVSYQIVGDVVSF